MFYVIEHRLSDVNVATSLKCFMFIRILPSSHEHILCTSTYRQTTRIVQVVMYSNTYTCIMVGRCEILLLLLLQCFVLCDLGR